MIRKISLLAIGLSLIGCTSVVKNNIITGKEAGGGVSITSAPSPGLQAGYLQSAIASVPALDSKGAVITHKVECNVESGLNTYVIQNGNASASAGGATSPSTSSIAINEATVTGRAAELAALGGGQAPTADKITADKDCSKSVPK